MDFWLYLARRTAHTAATLILLLVFMYTLFRLIPGEARTAAIL